MIKTFEELMAEMNEDDRKTILSYADSRVSTGIRKYLENHPNGEDPEGTFDAIRKRLNRIEAAAGEKQKALDLKWHALKTCYAKGVDFALVEDILPMFPDETAIDKKIVQLSEGIASGNVQRLNEKLVGESYRPQSGKSTEPPDLARLHNMTQSEANQLESTGFLDRLFRKH